MIATEKSRAYNLGFSLGSDIFFSLLITRADLSRFGRNYKETGNYLERIFPFLGVRFIAVNDGFDTLTAQRGTDGYLVPLKNLINEVYSKDISRKSGSALAAKQKNGDFIGAWAPYGYRKCPDDPHKLEPDEATAPVVRQIFRWRAEGIGVTQIARRLNDRDVHSPSAYLYNTGACKTEKYNGVIWYVQTVKNIPSRQVYIGHMVQGTKRQSFYENRGQYMKPREEWIVVENTHEPLIDRETFDKVQELAQRKKTEYLDNLGRFTHLKTTENILKGLVVKRIFKLCMEGRGPMQIAKLLQEEKVLNPTAYKKREGIKTPSPETADPYHWNTNTVVHILERREYTGCTVNFKTYTYSIWDKKQRETPIEKQAVFYNAHPAIIEQEVFDKVQEIRQQRHRRTKTGKSSLFSGMVYCADCGAKMRYCTTNYFEKRQDHFVCANYRSNTGSCSAHFIRAVVLEDLVWMHMRTVISYVSRYEDHFRAVMEQKPRLSSEAAIRGHKKRLAQAEKRLGELDRLFIRIYEDNVAGKLSDERFALMSKTYEDEQAQLKVEIQTLQQEIEVQERQIENLEQFIQRVRKYEDLDELTPYALRELVKAIYIEAPDKSSGKRYQGIRISYDLVGFIPVEELLKQETA